MKTIFFDVDTQADFMLKEFYCGEKKVKGALYISGAEGILPTLKRVTDYARERRFRIIGSLDRHFGTEEYKHREGELKRWGGPFPDHCMNCTLGEEKIDETTVIDPTSGWKGQALGHMHMAHPHYLDDHVHEDLLKKYADQSALGLFFEKQSNDVFTNPAIERYLELAEVEQAIVYGVATDYCVKAAAIGLAQRGIDVYVLEDAIKEVAPDTGKKAIREMKKAGVKFAEFASLDDILKGGSKK